MLGVAAGLRAGGPALAAERVGQIGRDGLQPRVLQVEPGDTVAAVLLVGVASLLLRLLLATPVLSDRSARL